MSNSTRALILGAILLLALSYVFYFRWVAEDAYISFRYARNLVEGHGLVFNVGEKVEGYTNFLWTLLLAPGLAFNMNPQSISLLLGLIFSTISFAFLFLTHQKIFGKDSVPFFLFALAMNYTWACRVFLSLCKRGWRMEIRIDRYFAGTCGNDKTGCNSCFRGIGNLHHDTINPVASSE